MKALQRIMQLGARFAVLSTILIELPCLGANSLIIKHAGGPQQARPFTIFRVFVQGEMANYPHPRVGGTSLPVWQSNVQTRWPDGSVQQALISFPLDMAKGRALTVDFVNDPNACHLGNQAACDNAAPSQSQILAFNSGNWGASIETANQGTNTQTASARTMVQNGDWRYWIKGPVANIIIAEDRSPALKYDFGWHCGSGCAPTTAQYGTKFDYSQSSWTVDSTNRSLHPIFVLTQYQGWPGVKIEYILENDWIGSVQDQSYNLTLKSGQNLTNVQFSRNGSVQIARSRWRKTYWDGQAPGAVNIDYNLAYLISSRAIANYDTSKAVSGAAIGKEIQRWNASDQADIASARPTYSGTVYKSFPDTGGRPDIGLIPQWGVLYLFSMNPTLYQEVIGDAEAMGYAPDHYREADGSRWYDDLHTTSAMGRTVSADARPGFMSRDVQDKILSYAADRPTIVGGVSNNNWISMDVAHPPDPTYLAYLLTGDWYFLEEIYFWAAYDLTAATPGVCVWCRHDDWAFLNDSLGDTRGTAWQMRNVAHAAWVAPDGSSEKTYFVQKLNYNIAVREGIMNITNGNFMGDPRWTWGRNGVAVQRPDSLWWVGHNLGEPNGQSARTVDPAKACFIEAPWQENYVNISWGHIEELGFSSITPLRQTAAKNLLHMILDPGYTPKDLLAAYFVGTRGYAADCQQAAPLNTWADVINTITPTELAAARTRWSQGASDTVGGYPTIALGASSFLVGINDGSASGADAWAWMLSNVTNQTELNDNPMWAFVPRLGSPSNGSPCDLNQDGVVNILDVELAIQQSLGTISCGSANLLHDGCTLADVQIVMDAAVGQGCLIPSP